MKKYVVVFADGGRLRVAGSADSLPVGVVETSPGVYETGVLADGDPTFVLVPDHKYEQAED